MARGWEARRPCKLPQMPLGPTASAACVASFVAPMPTGCHPPPVRRSSLHLVSGDLGGTLRLLSYLPSHPDSWKGQRLVAWCALQAGGLVPAPRMLGTCLRGAIRRPIRCWVSNWPRHWPRTLLQGQLPPGRPRHRHAAPAHARCWPGGPHRPPGCAAVHCRRRAAGGCAAGPARSGAAGSAGSTGGAACSAAGAGAAAAAGSGAQPSGFPVGGGGWAARLGAAGLNACGSHVGFALRCGYL